MRSDKCTLREEWKNGTPFDPEDIVIYTDGSKMGASSGAGIFSAASITLGKFASIMQTEVFAIL